jgi:hypothetical protein
MLGAWPRIDVTNVTSLSSAGPPVEFSLQAFLHSSLGGENSDTRTRPLQVSDLTSEALRSRPLKILYPASRPIVTLLAIWRSIPSESLHAFSADNAQQQLTMLAATSKHYIFNRNSQRSPCGLDRLSMCNAVAVHLLLPEES